MLPEMNRILRYLLIAIAAVTVTFSPFLALAQERPHAFFEALYDVPVMPGLEEMKDQAMLFDKPGGRIASVLAASKDHGVVEIADFYARTLPQLGWEKTAENQYVREDNRLVLELSKRPPLTIAHFTLSPLQP